MKKYMVNLLTVEAEPMTLGEAIRTGIHQGFIDTHTQNNEGYKVVFHKDSVTWIPKEEFDGLYLPANNALEIMKSRVVFKSVMTSRMHDKINDPTFLNEESVYHNAVVNIMASNMLNDFYLHSQLYEAAEKNDNSFYNPVFPFDVANTLMRYGFAVQNVNWVQDQYFILKQLIAYHPSYFAKNPDNPVNPMIIKVMRELMDTCTTDNINTYHLIDINTGVHVKWDPKLSETEGTWRAIC